MGFTILYYSTSNIVLFIFRVSYFCEKGIDREMVRDIGRKREGKREGKREREKERKI